MTDPIVIASLNTKGGVGKTSFCHHITAPLVDAGKKVLLIDMDFQANLSRGLLGAAQIDNHPYELTSSAFFDETLVPDEDLILKTPLNKKPLKKKEVRNPDDVAYIIPAHKLLKQHMHPNPEAHGELQFALQMYLEEVKHDFDVVLIDCHPLIDLTAWNALIAAEFVVCPFQPEDYGAQGISLIQEAIDEVVSRYNPNLRLLGYLLNKVKNVGLHRTFQTLLRDYYKDDVFATVVPDAIQLAEAISNRMPIGRYKPKIKAAEAMRQLADEMLHRIDVIREQPARYYYLGNQVRQAS